GAAKALSRRWGTPGAIPLRPRTTITRTRVPVTMRTAHALRLLILLVPYGAGAGAGGAHAAPLQGPAGGGIAIGPGESCPPGTTEVRPGSCRAPQAEPPSILDYRPESTLVTAETPVP